MLTALIAENELLVRMGMISVVPWAEMDVALVGESEDGLKAWHMFQKYRPDIVILDLLMPGLSGEELLRRIRAVDRNCAVIVVSNLEEEETLNRVRQLGVLEILSKRSIKHDDLSAAVGRACAALRDGDGSSSGTNVTYRWESLFRDGRPDFPFPVQGMTGFRVFPDDRLTPALEHSLSALFLQKVGRQNTYLPFFRKNCQLLIWKELPARQIIESVLVDFARYVQDNLDARLGIVSVLEAVPDAQVPAAAQTFMMLLQEPRFFSHPLLLDANGKYVDGRLNAVRSRLSMCLPVCSEQDELIALKPLLERYPGKLDKGFDSILDDADGLLRALDLSPSQSGLWEMTGRICEKMQEKLRRFVGIRPEIYRVMAYIQSHLSENLPREQLSGLVNYESAYFSKLFKAETGMSCSDYLFHTRMLRAQELLRETNTPISEIAQTCGYLDYSYFSSRFRSFCGMTPREWRDGKSDKRSSPTDKAAGTKGRGPAEQSGQKR